MQEHVIDRTGWDDGPWTNEPDREQWKTKSGLPGLIVRNSLGALCGYVAVTKDHPAFRKNYDDVDVSVHGGLTYANACNGAICHVPEPGEPDDVWWLGFDCCHLGDMHPAETKFEKLPGWPKRPASLTRGSYRDMIYVRAEVESLADQLSAMK